MLSYLSEINAGSSVSHLSVAQHFLFDLFSLIRRHMKMSQSQFDSVDENTRQSFLDKKLWIKENYEVCDIEFSIYACLFSFFHICLGE